MIETIAIIVLLAWLVQLALAYRQARLFYKRISSLRKLGRCATGLAGGRYRGRVYVALVAHPLTRKVIIAEQLQGFTVFASLKPIPQLEGRSLDDIVDPAASPIEGISQKLQEAARSAARAIMQSFDKVPSTT
ncbi:MAG TPA: transcriptional regulator GutM [Ktedonobacteraceae bacterium]|nr:transcriptional regulator GutM [Ktedonobacteraceae bacterium]